MRNQVWALALAMMVGAMGISIANVALPDIARAFGVTAQGANRVSVVYLAAVTVAAVLVGRIGDWFGRGRVLRAALVGFAGASVLAALSPTMGALIAARAVQGVFGAALMVLSVGLVRQISGPTRSGRMVGALGSMSALGTATGPVIGGVLVDLSGWRACFLVLAGVAAVAGMIARIPDGAASVQSGQGAPRGLWVGYLANLGVATVMMGTLVVGPFFLSFGAGLSARMVGVVMAVGPVMSIIGGVMAGRAVDRFGAGPVARLGSWLVALGSFMLALLSPVWGVLGYLIGITVLTPGYQLFQAGNTSAMMTRAPKGVQGGVAGALGMARNLGLLIGAWAFGALFTRALGGVPVQSAGAGDIGDAVRVVFLVACVGMIGLGVLLWRRG